MAKFNPRDIPNRAHYDRLQTWALDVLGKQSFPLADIQSMLSDDAAAKAHDGNDFERIQATLAEIGFCAIIDRMAEIIEESEGGNNGHG